MTALVIAEHDNNELKVSTQNTISAASKLDGDIHVLVAGSECNSVAEEASTCEGVTKVLYVDSKEYENFLAENIANLIKNVSDDYSSILAPATTNGKNYMPRVAALLDVLKFQISAQLSQKIPFKDRFMLEIVLLLFNHRIQKK